MNAMIPVPKRMPRFEYVSGISCAGCRSAYRQLEYAQLEVAMLKDNIKQQDMTWLSFFKEESDRMIKGERKTMEELKSVVDVLKDATATIKRLKKVRRKQRSPGLRRLSSLKKVKKVMKKANKLKKVIVDGLA